MRLGRLWRMLQRRPTHRARVFAPDVWPDKDGLRRDERELRPYEVRDKDRLTAVCADSPCPKVPSLMSRVRSSLDLLPHRWTGQLDRFQRLAVRLGHVSLTDS